MGKILTIRDFEDQTFDPYDEGEAYGEFTDFWRYQLAAWEKGGAVQRGSFRNVVGMVNDVSIPDDQQVFMVFGTPLVRQILNDPATYSQDIFKLGFKLAFGASITQMNPPEHTRYRRILQKAFLPGVVQEWSKKLVEPVVQELIEGFKHLDRVDIVQAFTIQYPFEIIYRQLRLPPAETATFHKLAVAMTLFASNMEKSVEAGRNLGEYFEALLQERRRHPGDDLISMLAQVEVDGEHLPDEMIVSFVRQLINAAGDTTYRSTSNLLVCLLRDRPDQYRMLVNDRSLVPAAIEEGLRLYSPLPYSMRTVMRDVELGGVKIPAGSLVEAATGPVGRDPAVFPDPHRYDLTRGNSDRHMAFSNGPHVCLGQHLAKLEMGRALNALLDHFPNLRLDEDYPPPQVYGQMMMVTREVHVRLH